MSRTPTLDRSTSARALVRLAGLGVALCGLQAAAQAAAPGADIESRYRTERASCLDGSSNEDRRTCLQEAGAARDAARKGRLDNGHDDYAKHARARCDALQGDDARDCLSRVRGQGFVSGSVRDGGILRETVTTTVGPVVPLAVIVAP